MPLPRSARLRRASSRHAAPSVAERRPPRGLRFLVAALLGAAGLLAMPAAAEAQWRNLEGVDFTGALGLALPTGDLGDVASTGFYGEGGIIWRPRNTIVAIRPSFFFTRLSTDGPVLSDETIAFDVDGDVTLYGVKADVLVPVVYRDRWMGYALGGLGTVRQRIEERGTTAGRDFETADTQTRLLYSLGVGAEAGLGRVTGYAELRWTRLNTDPTGTIWPLVVGVRF